IPGQVRHGALVAAVDPDRPLAAGGATALRLVGADDEGNQLRSGNDRVKPQETGISDQRWCFHTQRIPVPAVVYSLTFTKSAEEPRYAALRFGSASGTGIRSAPGIAIRQGILALFCV